TLQQQTFPVVDARILAFAKVPGGPNPSKNVEHSAMYIMLGGALGAGLGFLRERRDQSFRTKKEVRKFLGIEKVWSVPRIDASGGLNVFSQVQARNFVPADYTKDFRDVVLTAFEPQLFETLRSVKFNLDFRLRNERQKVLGIVSALAGEGKSTL